LTPSSSALRGNEAGEHELWKLDHATLEEPRRRSQDRQGERPLGRHDRVALESNPRRRAERHDVVRDLHPARCSRRQLEEVARLDVVELPAGTVELDGRELVVTLDPVRALVVGRLAVPALLELVPDLATAPREEAAWRAGSPGPALRLHPA
jgi:hypothetical protein